MNVRLDRVPHNHVTQGAAHGCLACRLRRPEVMNTFALKFMISRPEVSFGPVPNPD